MEIGKENNYRWSWVGMGNLTAVHRRNRDWIDDLSFMVNHLILTTLLFLFSFLQIYILTFVNSMFFSILYYDQF